MARETVRLALPQAEVLTMEEAWPQAKALAMEVDVDVQQFGQPWAAVWRRAKARSEEEAKARARARKARMWRQMEVEAEAAMWSWLRGSVWRTEVDKLGVDMAENPEEVTAAAVAAKALALAGVWGWAKAHARGESVPSGLADSATIRDILTDHHRSRVARDLWHHSPEYSCIIRFIAPITCLPFELLHQIFLIIINEASSPPSVLMRVCKQWHAIVTGIWASLNLGTRTPLDTVTRKLERNQWLLDIVVDTDSDRGHFTPSDDAFDAIFAAIEARSRWRSLVVKSFPAQDDLPDDVVNRNLQRCSNATMSRFTTFKIKSACQTSPLLDGILHILGTTAGPGLTTVEINSANAVSFLAPAYPTIFHSVKVLSLDTPGMSHPVDLLPHLHQLESLTASHISFPIDHNDVNLPFVHTLRHLSLTAVPIQWMSGRTFHVLDHCTLISPLHRHVVHTFKTTLPNCRHLTFQGYPLEVLGGVLAHKLTHLSVVSSRSFNGRGNRQLVWLSHQILGECQLTPQILHINIEAASWAWVNALAFMSGLEELVIHNARPSSLGAKAFQPLVAQRGYVKRVSASNPHTTLTSGEFGAPLCPSLRRFGLKYDRWLRPSEQFDLIPVFASIIQSRQHSKYSLESFRLWLTSDEKDPLELVERSEMSVEGFRRLAEKSGVKKDY